MLCEAVRSATNICREMHENLLLDGSVSNGDDCVLEQHRDGEEREADAC